MFLSQPMERVELVVPEHDIVAVTEVLAGLRVLHVADAGASGGEGGISQTTDWDKSANTYTSLVQRITDVMELLGVDAGAPPKEALHLISPDVAERDVDMVEQEAKGPAQELDAARRRLERLQLVRSQLLPLVELNFDLQQLRKTTYLFAMLGTMPVDNVERLDASLEHVPSALVVLREREHLATVVLFGLKRDAEMLTRAARSAYLNASELSDDYKGTPATVVAALDESISRAGEQITGLGTTLHHLHETRIRRLRHLFWRVRASLKLVQTIAKFKQFRYTYLITGWVPAPKVEGLRKAVAVVSEDTVVEVHDPTARERSEVPFEFSNPRVMRPFQKLVTIYGYPGYGELDPTPLLAITFPLIFGVMFGDVGHGLLLVLLGILLLSRKVRALQGAAGFGGIVVACGAVATLFGFLYGSIFGFEEVLPALWLRPLERTNQILLASVGFGMVVLTVGMVLNVIGASMRRQWAQVVVDRHGLAGILFYWSLVGLGAGFMKANIPLGPGVLVPVALVTALVIALSGLLAPILEGGSLQKHDLGMTLVEGFFELFETVLSVLSNTLSYVRMGAFAVAHGALSLVVFILAKMVDPGQGVFYWIVVALGNLLVIGFEGMIVAIQTLRLEYYEFFSKFFVAGGRRYQPLTLVAGEEA